MKSGNKAAYTAELLAVGGLASVVCTCRRVNCTSVIGMIIVHGYTRYRLDCWIGKVTTVARGKQISRASLYIS